MFNEINKWSAKLIILNARLYLKKERKGLFTQIGHKFTETLDNALGSFYSFVSNRISEPYDIIMNLNKRFYYSFKDKSELLFLTIHVGIRTLILFSFLIDVFCFFRLNHMYKTLYLLVVSLLIKIIFYILRDFASNLELAESVLIIEDCGIDIETGLPLTNYKLKPQYSTLDLEYHVQQFILCSKVSGSLEIYDDYATRLNPIINIFISLLYLIRWSYILV